jgi:isoquinoline 1-oxidoreductase alpha subunit
MISFQVNSENVAFDGDETTPLLWVLREQFNLTGTKFGCGIGQCGACTVHVDGGAQRSCLTPVSAVSGKSIAWLELDVPQCGYCQAGQIMATADLLQRIPNPTDADIDANLTNLCRCGTYARIRKAIHRAVELQSEGGSDDR